MSAYGDWGCPDFERYVDCPYCDGVNPCEYCNDEGCLTKDDLADIIQETKADNKQADQ